MENSNKKRFLKGIPFNHIYIIVCFMIVCMKFPTPACKYPALNGYNHSVFSISQLCWTDMTMQIALPTDNVNLSRNYSLFYIERNCNANRIHYDINLNEEGELNTLDPIDVYWIKYEKGEKKISLSWIERTFAYGLKVLSASQSEAVFQFVSYEKRDFNLKKDTHGQFRVFTISQGKQIELSKLFVHVAGGTILLPKISKIELHGKDMDTGINTLEIIYL